MVGTVLNRATQLREEWIIRRMVPNLDARQLGFGVTARTQFQIPVGHLSEVEHDLGRDPLVGGI